MLNYFRKTQKICFIKIIAILSSYFIFSKALYADETYEREIIENKPVVRSIVDYNREIKDLEELEDISGLIIRGIIQDGKEQLTVSEYQGYTKTKVLVTGIIKGDTSLLNKIIVYREPYFERETNGVSEYWVSSNYKPAVVNNEYILFLSKYTGNSELYKDTYSLKYHENGKYPVNDNLKKLIANTDAYVDSLSNEELDIGPANSNVYRDFYKSIIDKYILSGNVSNTENVNQNANISENEKEIESIALDKNEVINKNGNILIPIRTAAEFLGCKINWKADTKIVIVEKNDKIAEFPINHNYYILNNIIHNINFKAEIYDNKTYVPINIINEVFELELVYNNIENTISLSHKK